jgi:glycosyltransferase involved in cell wall biosynthesis
MRRTYVVGYFGYKTGQLDGQTIKTRNVYRLLKEEFDPFVNYFDTQSLRRNPLSIIKMFFGAIRCNKLVLIPAHNNLKYLFPLFFLLSKLFNFSLLYIAVGGWLVEYLRHFPIHRKMLSKVQVVFPQTVFMKEQLENNYGFKNVSVLPNFRMLEQKQINKGTPVNKKNFNIVFFARIHEMKGLDYMAHLAVHISKVYKNKEIEIDFFGPIHDGSRLFFEKNLLCHSFVSYKGVLSPCEVKHTLSNYDVLVLPTHYYTEGFPGSVLDAYLSSIPVIVTQWKYAFEFVEECQTGFVIPFDNGTNQLCEKIDFLYRNPLVLRAMKINAGKKGKSFSPEIASEILSSFFGQSSSNKIMNKIFYSTL